MSLEVTLTNPGKLSKLLSYPKVKITRKHMFYRFGLWVYVRLNVGQNTIFKINITCDSLRILEIVMTFWRYSTLTKLHHVIYVDCHKPVAMTSYFTKNARAKPKKGKQC